MAMQEIIGDEAAAAVDLPESVTAALSHWAGQLAQNTAAPLRERLARMHSELYALRQQHEQTTAERDELSAKLGEITADRDQALVRLAERDAGIERLTIELRNARDIASNALVGKAKDQLAIEGKDAQLADLRRQLEQQVAASAAQSDARLAAEMELVGAATARDNFAAEISELRAQLDRCRAELGGA